MIKIPDYFKALPSQPNEPPHCETFGVVMKDHFNCMVRRYPIPTQYTNPWDEKKVVDIIHQQLEEDQGLIEVQKGTTKKGIKYVLAITKTYMGPQYGIQYFLRFNYLTGEEWSEEVDAFFGEEGTTGTRDAFVMGLLNCSLDEWMEDPYDKGFSRGIRMNKSENKEYDKRFPYHPLSKCRELIEFILENN